MTSLQIQYFLSVAKTENVSKSARLLHVSQPALSKVIKALEEDLGVQLFDRQGRSVGLNAYGMVVQEKLNTILQTQEELKYILNDMQNGSAGTIRIGTSVPVRAGTNWLICAIDSYNELYPKVRFDVFQMRQNSLKEALLSNEIDFAVSSLDISSREILWEYLFSESLMIALGPDNPLCGEPVHKMMDFRSETFLCNDSNSDIIELTNALCNTAGFTPDIARYGGFSSLIRSAIFRNEGVTIVLKEGISDLINGEVLTLACDSPTCDAFAPKLYRKIGIAYMAPKYQLSSAINFIRYLQDAAAKLPDRFRQNESLS